jgi:hypothetical protein
VSNHEKKRIPPKRKEKPDHKDRIKLLGRNISISTENFSVIMILVSKAQCNFLNSKMSNDTILPVKPQKN